MSDYGTAFDDGFDSEQFEEFLRDSDHQARRGGARMRGFWHDVTTLGRMARACARGEYELATPKIAMLVATLGYVAVPVDAVPDVVPIAGLLDDAGVVAATVGALAYEVVCFREWERGQQVA